MTALYVDDLAKNFTPATGVIMRLYAALYESGQPLQPSLLWTADRTGFDEKTVRRANDYLLASGFIEIAKIRAPGRPWSHNVYRLAGRLLDAVTQRLAKIAAASARTIRDAAAEAIRLQRRLWHRRKRDNFVTPDKLPNEPTFFLSNERKKETPTPGPTGQTAFLQQWAAGKIQPPDLSGYFDRKSR